MIDIDMVDIAIEETPAAVALADLGIKDNAVPGLLTTLQGLDALQNGHSNGQTKKWKKLFGSRKDEV